jgi:hypothetical protein
MTCCRQILQLPQHLKVDLRKAAATAEEEEKEKEEA